jgi:Kef-type K+ transport system membrane component KefB
MENLMPQHITVMFLSLGILLGVARLLGELAQRWRQPAVLGELLAGILLGQTILGSIAPEISAFLFPLHGPSAIALETIATLAIVLFLMVAGIEVDLSTIWRQGKVGLRVGIASMIIPFLCGLAAAWLAPRFLGRHPDADPFIFALFFAIAMSISALPVIAKTLMDMNLYRSDLGMVVISAAIFNDLAGWIVFAVVLGLMGAPSGNVHNITLTITLTLAFAGAMLTAGRWLIHKVLPFVQAYSRWPGGELSFTLTLAILAAAFTEWIGIHAIFGAFLVGVAVGDSSHLRERTRVIIEQFVSFIFAPVFFASIGLKVNFLTHFDGPLVLTVLVIACVCKLAGGTLGARWGGMPSRESWAVGFAMNSRGAMEIILGLLALEAGIIPQRLFVALVIMAIVTSMMSGPAMRLILREIKKHRLRDALSSKLFLRSLKASTRLEAIHEMTAAVCEVTGLDAAEVEKAVLAHKGKLCDRTGPSNGVAIPHARIDGLTESLVAVGVSATGIDFNAPDNKPAKVIFLVLTPSNDPRAQLNIASEITRLFHDRHMLDRVLGAKSITDLLALIRASMPAKSV